MRIFLKSVIGDFTELIDGSVSGETVINRLWFEQTDEGFFLFFELTPPGATESEIYRTPAPVVVERDVTHLTESSDLRSFM